MKETEHDYQGCLTGNHYINNSSVFENWDHFKNTWLGFRTGLDKYDDTYHFIFRYDIHKINSLYVLELCIMLQRKGIYVKIQIWNITQLELDNEVKKFLSERKKYIVDLWKEV